jgi:hypothetical protein
MLRQDPPIADRGQGVQVGNEIEGTVALALQVNVLPDRTKVIAPMKAAGRLNAG